MCLFGSMRRNYFRPSRGASQRMNTLGVTSAPELLSNVARGVRRCGANGKSVTPAKTLGRTMLKV